MVPTFMTMSDVRRSDGRTDEFGQYLRNEYGSLDRAWLMTEVDHQFDKAGASIGSRLKAWLGRKSRGDSSVVSEAG